MSIFSRLAIGTAAWGKEYNGVKISEDDQKRILDYCQCSGIDMIDTAVAYEWDWTKISSYFHINLKLRIHDLWDCNVYCCMAHDIPMYYQMEHIHYDNPSITGVSLYEPSELGKISLQKVDIVQIPYSIFDRRFEPYFNEFKSTLTEIHVRSIFLRGKILERFEPWECIAFCLANPLIDRIIIGVDSYQQLKDNLRIFHRWESSGVEDENILDPRKWEGDK